MHSFARFCLWRPLAIALAVGSGLMLLLGAAAAQVKPGGFINDENAAKVRVIPNGTDHANSPVFAFTAIRRPHGGF